MYELIAGTLASYLLGDSVTQFSTVIAPTCSPWGSAPGCRATWSGPDRPLRQIELAVGLLGGFSAPVLFLIFAWFGAFQLALYVLVLLIGILVGLEIPLIMRILKQQFAFRTWCRRC